MNFTQLYSSSKGNLYTVTARSGKRLLIECGVVWSKLQKAVKYDLASIEGCLLSHEHKDHSKAIADVMTAGICVYSAGETCEALNICGNRHSCPVSNEEYFTIGEFHVLTFPVNHDCAHALGYIIKADDEILFFACDTSHISQRFRTKFSIIALECSFDKHIIRQRLASGEMNEALAQRLLTSHMDKDVTLDYLRTHCDFSKVREIHLLHCSESNLDKQAMKAEFEKQLFTKVVVL